MSTRSVIAIADGDSWRGRYCHSDGYPSWNGRVLWNAVVSHPDGVDVAISALEAFLIDGPGELGISHIREISFLANTKLMDWADPFGESTGNVRVYKGRPGEENTTPHWYTPATAEEEFGMEEYLYIVSRGGLIVASTWQGIKVLGTFRYDEPEPDWNAVETADNNDEEAVTA